MKAWIKIKKKKKNKIEDSLTGHWSATENNTDSPCSLVLPPPARPARFFRLLLAGGRDPPVYWRCPPRCGAPLRRAPRGVVCTPVVGACPVCCPPPAVGSCPVCWCPPPRCCGPDRDHCYY